MFFFLIIIIINAIKKVCEKHMLLKHHVLLKCQGTHVNIIYEFVGNFCPLSSSMSAHPNCVQGKPDSYITSNLVKYAHVKLNV